MIHVAFRVGEEVTLEITDDGQPAPPPTSSAPRAWAAR